MKKLALLLAMLMLAGSACAEEFFAEEEPAGTQDSAFSEDFFAEDGADDAAEAEEAVTEDAEDRSIIATAGDDVSDAEADQYWASVMPVLSFEQTTNKKHTALTLGSVTFEWSLDVQYADLAAQLKQEKGSAFALHLYQVDRSTGIARDVKKIPLTKSMKKSDGTIGGAFTLTKLTTGEYNWVIRLEKTTKTKKGSAECYGKQTELSLENKYWEYPVLGKNWAKTTGLTIEQGEDDPLVFTVQWASECVLANACDLTVSVEYADGDAERYSLKELENSITDLTYSSVYRSNGVLNLEFKALKTVSRVSVAATPTYEPGLYDIPTMTGASKTAVWAAPSDAWKTLNFYTDAEYDWVDMDIYNNDSDTLPDSLTFTGLTKSVTVTLKAEYDPDDEAWNVTCKVPKNSPIEYVSCYVSCNGETILGYRISVEAKIKPTAKSVSVTPKKKNGKKTVSGTTVTKAIHVWMAAPSITSLKQTGDRTASLSFDHSYIDSNAVSYAVSGFAKTLVLIHDDAGNLTFEKDYGADYTLSGTNDTGYTVAGPVKKTGNITFSVTPRMTYTFSAKKSATVAGTAAKQTLKVAAAKTAACVGIVPGTVDADGNLDVTFKCYRTDVSSFRVTAVQRYFVEGDPEYGDPTYDQGGLTGYSYFSRYAKKAESVEQQDTNTFTASFTGMKTGRCTIFVETILTDGARIVDTASSVLERAEVLASAPDMSFFTDDITAGKFTDKDGKLLGYHLDGRILAINSDSRIFDTDDEGDSKWDCDGAYIKNYNGSGLYLFSTDNVKLMFRYREDSLSDWSAWTDPVEIVCGSSLSAGIADCISNDDDIATVKIGIDGGIKSMGYTYSVSITDTTTGETICTDSTETEYTLPYYYDYYHFKVSIVNNGVYYGGSLFSADYEFDW